jgi:hypothetical protein
MRPFTRGAGQTCEAACILLPLRSRRESNPNRQIRRLVIYVHAVSLSDVRAAQVRGRIQPDRQSPDMERPVKATVCLGDGMVLRAAGRSH